MVTANELPETKNEKEMTTERTHEFYAAIAGEEHIRSWERRRDEALRVKCPLVAAKFQRWIDRERESLKALREEGRHP